MTEGQQCLMFGLFKRVQQMSLFGRTRCDLPLCVFRREGDGLRIFWDRLRDPSFTSRWNPFTTDFPYITFTYHPVGDISDTFTSICDVRGSVSRNKRNTCRILTHSR